MKSRKLNNTPRKEDILRLRSEGKTYNEIQSILGCSKSTISYHCGEGSEKQRTKKRNKEASHKFTRKITAFKSRKNHSSFRTKVKTFKRRNKNNRTHTTVNNISKNFTAKDVVKHLGDSPVCYLTGIPIDLSKPDTYHFDHIIPTSKGGTNDLFNLGICTREANYAKGDLSLDELYDLCKTILKWRDEKNQG